MRVLIFSLAYYPVVGGAEVAIKEITDRIPDIEFDMVTMRFDKSHPKFERIGNVNVYRIGGGLGYLSKILFIPDAAAFAVTMHRKRRYDLFWAMMTYMTWPVVIARLLGNRTPYVITLQDGDPFEHVFKRSFIKPFKPLLGYGFKHALVVQTISHFLADWANRLGYKGRPEVIPNGVDTSLFAREYAESELSALKEKLGKREDDVFLITTSRLVEKNGIGDVIESLRSLPENVKFLVLGTGPLEASVREKANALGLAKRVLFLGYVEHKEMPKYLKISDIFIRPSLSEGMGNSFIEAMAAGIPVIATPVGGIPDFLFDPDKDHDTPPTGLFVNVRDPKSIAAQVGRLISNTELSKTLVENAKKLALEKYDWNLIAEEMKKRVFKPFL